MLASGNYAKLCYMMLARLQSVNYAFYAKASVAQPKSGVQAMGFSRVGIGVFVVAALGFLGAGIGVFVGRGIGVFECRHWCFCGVCVCERELYFKYVYLTLSSVGLPNQHRPCLWLYTYLV